MNVESLYLVVKIVLLAWFISELTPLQMVFEWIAERNGVFNTVFYSVLSCWYCLAFWIGLIFFTVGIGQGVIPDWLTYPIAGAFTAFNLQKITKS